MTTLHRYVTHCYALLAVLFVLTKGTTAEESFAAQPGEHICYIGNTLADRMQHHAWLETYLHALHPRHELVFRNLGFAGDEVARRPRSDNFGSPDQWLSKCEADTVFCFFGYNESLRGEAGLPAFRDELASMMEGMRARRYNGKTAPRLVVFSPIAHEDLNNPHLPDGSVNNARIEAYTSAIRSVCATQGVMFVDLFSLSKQLYSQSDRPLTINGVHLLDHGNQALAKAIVARLLPGAKVPADRAIAALREAVLDKNYHWFSRYRVVDGYNVYGGRSKLAWHGQSNADVMRREMEIFDVMTANRDRQIWARAQGNELVVADNNVPNELLVKTNKEGPLAEGAFPYLGAEAAIDKMDVHDGMRINLFASEEQFPRLANPVQMAVDTNSRLWVSVWPSYPHWNPTEPRRDALLILPDEDGDGVADKCTVFADQLNSITGFEFWGGGVIVAAPPELWFLQDTDGDDRADRKVRLLQGLSSADTHHSANAMLIGPDGWLYWSRGVFNLTNVETPTRTYRSAQTGVHRFNPRTFEVEFHFPIGPNPHGHIFDRWGYEFANDGTTGTGSYVNIGKGVANKQWYQMRVRPVAATGLLSSGHFPQRLRGNYLICNTIGVLGVLQHQVRYAGADIVAHEIDPIVVSDDPNFRPSDVEIGGDGALYIADWHNSLIGHMQHNMRDPNRDHTHGRIYRVTHDGRDLLPPAKMKGQPIDQVCQHFFAKENGTRYRARLELSGRTTDEVIKEMSAFLESLNCQHVTDDRDEAQAMLECLWVMEEHRIPRVELVARLLRAGEPRIRAAAIRTLGHWHHRTEGWQPLLLAAARDASPLVRAEAIKAAVEFRESPAEEVVFEVAARTLDPELERLVDYARGEVQPNERIDALLAEQRPLSSAAFAFLLKYGSPEQLAQLPPSDQVDRAIVLHRNAPPEQLRATLLNLAKRQRTSVLTILLELIATSEDAATVARLSPLLGEQPRAELQGALPRVRNLASQGQTREIRSASYAAWAAAAGPEAVLAAVRSAPERLLEFLHAVPSLRAEDQQNLYAQLESVLWEVSSETSPGPLQPGMQVDYFDVSPGSAAPKALAKLTPVSSYVTPRITIDHPDGIGHDQFALRFVGQIRIPASGEYTFFTRSDDGSRLYIDGELVVDNDQVQSTTERKATVDLKTGCHPLIVTYFDAGGASSLGVSWSGAGIKKQPLPAEMLFQATAESLTHAVIRALVAIPDHEQQNFVTLSQLIQQNKHRAAAIEALTTLPVEAISPDQSRALGRHLIEFLRALPVGDRTSSIAEASFGMAESLLGALPPDEARRIATELAELKVRVIDIGTVPHRMLFDREQIVVEAGRPVEFRFVNTDAMPHNFAIVRPGTLAEVGELAEATGREPSALDRHYVPVTDKVIASSRLLHPGERQSIGFAVPRQPGIYPYVCTYPGHWRRMFGSLVVVNDLAEYKIDPANYLTANSIQPQDPLLQMIGQSHAWTYEELVADIQATKSGRSHTVGKRAFTAATCVGCHHLSGEGHTLGPDLSKLAGDKHQPEFILRSLLQPSARIDEEFQSYTFYVDSGQVVSGIVLEESEEEIKVGVGPLGTGELCGDSAFVLRTSQIDERIKSGNSLMPEGLLDRLTREEILDLIAYVYARGQQGHEVFADPNE